MKELIIKALDEANEKFKKQTPETKKQLETINIENVSPFELVKFMEENNIPENAWFTTQENYGMFGCTEVLLAWNIEVPTTEKDKLEYIKKQFKIRVFKFVYNTLTENGYKRVGCWSSEYKKFDDTTVYEMYINKDFDRLVKYYSLTFKKDGKENSI